MNLSTDYHRLPQIKKRATVRIRAWTGLNQNVRRQARKKFKHEEHEAHEEERK
jgi:hypothetical protein